MSRSRRQTIVKPPDGPDCQPTLQDDGRSLERPLNKPYLFAIRADVVMLLNHMSMRVDLKIAKNRCNAIFESFREEAFEPLGFLVHSIRGDTLAHRKWSGFL